MIVDAHHTSANYESGVSEFNKTNLKEEWKEGIGVPFTKVVQCNYIVNM
jgi:hypothetical protein